MSNSSNSSVIIDVPSYDMYAPNWIEFYLRIAQAVLIILLNAFVLLVFVRMKKYTFSNVLFISLTLSDLLDGLFEFPLTIINDTFIFWPAGDVLCYIHLIFKFAQLRVSNETILVMAVHRFIQFIRPINNQEKLDWKKKGVIMFTWVFPFVYSIFMVTGFYLTGDVYLQYCAINFPPAFVTFHALVVDIAPTFITILLNFHNIYALYRKYQASLQLRSKRKTASATHTSRSGVPDSIRPDSRSMGMSFVDTSVLKVGDRAIIVENKISNTKRDLKAAVCILTIILNIVIIEYPSNFLWIYYSYNPSQEILVPLILLSKIIYFFPIINPLLLCIFHTSFQTQSLAMIRKLFCFRNVVAS